MVNKVIIIEDEDIIRKGLVYSIPWDDLNCSVIAEADNGEEGLRLIQTLNPDIVLVDINIPFIDGLTMLEKTKNTHNLSIIIISGSNDFKNAKKAIELGAVRYVEKPIDKDELYDAIKDAIERKKLREKVEDNQNNFNDLIANFTNNVDMNTVQSSIVHEMLEQIHENYSKSLYMKDLVDVLNYSETFLNLNFKKETGLTFNKYLTNFRIQKSIELLFENPSISIKEVSHRCGFSDYKYFHTVFKRHTGYSPKEFITNLLGNYIETP